MAESNQNRIENYVKIIERETESVLEHFECNTTNNDDFIHVIKDMRDVIIIR